MSASCPVYPPKADIDRRPVRGSGDVFYFRPGRGYLGLIVISTAASGPRWLRSSVWCSAYQCPIPRLTSLIKSKPRSLAKCPRSQIRSAMACSSPVRGSAAEKPRWPRQPTQCGRLYQSCLSFDLAIKRWKVVTVIVIRGPASAPSRTFAASQCQGDKAAPNGARGLVSEQQHLR